MGKNAFSGGVPEEAQGRFDLTAVLMNLTVYPLIVLWTIAGLLVSPVVLVFWKLIARWEADRIVRCFIWIYGRVWMVIVGPFVRFHREGFQDVDFSKPCVFIINHRSFFDTYCMAALPISNIAFAVRAWPFKMLWFTLFMRLARYLNVENMDWEETLAHSRQILDKDGSILFFPEGHRSRNGELQRFYSGAFLVAVENQVPIVPLCITGTGDLLPPGRFWLRPAQIRIRALPAVSPADFSGENGHVEMRKHVKARMQEALAQMQSKAA